MKIACLLIAAASAAPSVRADDLPHAPDAADLQPASKPADQTQSHPTTTINRLTHDTGQEFIPLLASKLQPKAESSSAESVFHGWLRVHEQYQRINNGTEDNSNRLETGGAIDRLYGHTLALVWNGYLSYRNGTAATLVDDYRHPRLRMFEMALVEKAEDGGIRRLGRFIPVELPGLGHVDGLQMEMHPTENFHLGAVVGARPERREFEPSSRELMTSAYGSYQQGTPNGLFYAGTLGFFQTFFRGARDELGVLYDQRTDFGPKLNVYLSSQLNFNGGAARVHTEDVRVTRLDYAMTSPVTQVLALHAGVNHYERSDTAAERDISGGSLAFIDDGYWNYWTGCAEQVPWDLRLDEEFALIQAAGQRDQGQVRGSISRQGLFIFPRALLSLSAYSLTRLDGSGVGSVLSANFPLMNNRLNLALNSGVHYSSPEGPSKSLKFNDASMFLAWFITKMWELDFGIAQTYRDSIESTLVDVDLNYRW